MWVMLSNQHLKVGHPYPVSRCSYCSNNPFMMQTYFDATCSCNGEHAPSKSNWDGAAMLAKRFRIMRQKGIQTNLIIT